ncbi:hypothetical protein L9F63_013770, partial [Diploptera punctata]
SRIQLNIPMLIFFLNLSGHLRMHNTLKNLILIYSTCLVKHTYNDGLTRLHYITALDSIKLKLFTIVVAIIFYFMTLFNISQLEI